MDRIPLLNPTGSVVIAEDQVRSFSGLEPIPDAAIASQGVAADCPIDDYSYFTPLSQ